jgi:uncharacterized protein with HEPN domain
MPPESRKLLTDILEAARSIQQFVSKKTLDDFKSDDALRSSNYFKFVIIGEAMSQLRQRDAAQAQQITEHDRIIAFRNQIIHGYGRIDDEITWRIIEQKIPILISEIEEMLKP